MEMVISMDCTRQENQLAIWQERELLGTVRVMARENWTRKEECEISYEMRFSNWNGTEDWL